MPQGFWAFLPSSVLSADGTYELSSLDHESFLVRMGGVVAIVDAEDLEDEAGGGVLAFAIPPDQEVLTIEGERPITPAEHSRLIQVITAAAPVLQRRVVFV